MAASQREATEARGAASESIEGEVRQVAQVGQVQLLQTRQSWSNLEQDTELKPPLHITALQEI